jgi:hypothetical protein
LNLFGVCSATGALGYKCVEDLARPCDKLETWKANQAAELVASLPVLQGKTAPEAVAQGVHLAAKAIGDGKPCIGAKIAGIPKSVLSGWTSGNFRLSLPLLLNLCAAGNFSLVSIYLGCPATTSSSATRFTPLPKRINRKCVSANQTVRQMALRAAAESADCPSLASVCNSLKVDPKSLRVKFPRLCKVIVRRHKEKMESDKSARFIESKALARTALKTLLTRNLPITSRNMKLVSGKILNLNVNFTNALNEVLVEDGFSEISSQRKASFH